MAKTPGNSNCENNKRFIESEKSMIIQKFPSVENLSVSPKYDKVKPILKSKILNRTSLKKCFQQEVLANEKIKTELNMEDYFKKELIYDNDDYIKIKSNLGKNEGKNLCFKRTFSIKNVNLSSSLRKLKHEKLFNEKAMLNNINKNYSFNQANYSQQLNDFYIKKSEINIALPTNKEVSESQDQNEKVDIFRNVTAGELQKKCPNFFAKQTCTVEKGQGLQVYDTVKLNRKKNTLTNKFGFNKLCSVNFNFPWGSPIVVSESTMNIHAKKVYESFKGEFLSKSTIDFVRNFNDQLKELCENQNKSFAFKRQEQIKEVKIDLEEQELLNVLTPGPLVAEERKSLVYKSYWMDCIINLLEKDFRDKQSPYRNLEVGFYSYMKTLGNYIKTPELFIKEKYADVYVPKRSRGVLEYMMQMIVRIKRAMNKEDFVLHYDYKDILINISEESVQEIDLENGEKLSGISKKSKFYSDEESIDILCGDGAWEYNITEDFNDEMFQHQKNKYPDIIDTEEYMEEYNKNPEDNN